MRGAWLALALLVAPAALANVLPPGPRPPPWRYTEAGETRLARVMSRNRIDLGYPFQGEQHGTLFLRRGTGAPEAFIALDRGVILCAVPRCRLRLGFDAVGASWPASPAGDNRQHIVFLDDATRFIDRVRGAERLLVELPMEGNGARVLEFPVERLDPARLGLSPGEAPAAAPSPPAPTGRR